MVESGERQRAVPTSEPKVLLDQISEVPASSFDSHEVLRFHQRPPGYSPTPLFIAAGLADRLGVGAAMIKDESEPLGLSAFKMLGAPVALAIPYFREQR